MFNKLILIGLPITFTLIGCTTEPNKQSNMVLNNKVTFTDVSKNVGINATPTWKYGGPSVADINNDGIYDFVLSNHDKTPVKLYLSNKDNTYSEQPDIARRADSHGIATADYDQDGDNDIIIALGGGNGTNPKPPVLLRNDNGVFVNATKEAGIADMGARGRSARWTDLDKDGDLDLIQINAEQMYGEKGPRNIIFKNIGNGKFEYQSSAAFEHIDAEKVFVTDFNQDKIPDLVAFSSYSPLSLWQGQGDSSLTFINVTQKMLPENLTDTGFVTAVAEADIDNDGDLDLYISRGKLWYQIANNAISFDEELQRLDLRDEGNKSYDGISFTSKNELNLLAFNHFPRGPKKIVIPMFLGNDKTKLTTPVNMTKVTPDMAKGFPKEVTESGWYLGYLGDDEQGNHRWRMEWLLKSNLAWDIRASIIGVNSIQPDWTPQNLGVPDVLLKNEGGKFTDISSTLPKESLDNNWGVSSGDFNNDTYNDFFIYRFGKLKQRIADVLFLNYQGEGFQSSLNHGANTLGVDAHGDMGGAFDYDLDGNIDLLNGDDDNGEWYLYKNTTEKTKNNHYLLTHVGYSTSGVDPIGAEIFVSTTKGDQYKHVGSGSAAHSQSLLNIAHFGLASSNIVDSVKVVWRDGSTEELKQVKANQVIKFGK